MSESSPLLLLTPGEPAGIGPDLAVVLAQSAPDATIVAVCDPDLLAERARLLGLPLRLRTVASPAAAGPPRAGELDVLPVTLAVPAVAGRLDPRNADYVLECIRRATALTLGAADALVTGPVHKGAINDAGYAFSGHTEFIAAACGAPTPVMMLLAGTLRVALATTHLPLRAVADAIDAARLSAVLEVLHADLRRLFGIADPRILVCGLNPHAGEGGHLGHEDASVIAPVVERLRAHGMQLRGPLPADTLFTPRQLDGADAVLAMYHDQGLPVLKYAGFGQAVNLTLGLPIIRTSVDHGTALELAGSGRAEAGSLRQALALAAELVRRRTGR